MGRQRRIGLEFEEEMSGYFAEGVEDFEEGFQRGKGQDNALSLKATIRIHSVSDFVKLSGRKAELTGTVSCEWFGEDIPIRNGEFNLFQPSRMTGKRQMIYSFGFTGFDDTDHFLYGQKIIYDDPGVDMHDDMTTLFAKIYIGDSVDGQLVGAGILRFQIRDLPSLLASFRVINADSFITKIKTVYQLYSFCYGEMRDTYLDKLSPIYYTEYENLVLSGKMVSTRRKPQDFFFFSGIHDKDFPWGDGGVFWDIALILRNSDGSWTRFLLTDRIIENLRLDIEKGLCQYEGEIYQIVEGYQASYSQLKKSPLPDHLKMLHAKIDIKFAAQAFETVDVPFALMSNYKKYIPDKFMADIEKWSSYLGSLGFHLTPHKVTVTEGKITILDQGRSRTYNIQADETLGEAEKSTLNSIEDPTLYYNYFCALNPESDHIYVQARSDALRESRKHYLLDKIKECLGGIVNQVASLDLEIQKGVSQVLPRKKGKTFNMVDENILQIDNDHFPTAVFQRRIVSLEDDASSEVFYALEEDMDTLNLSSIGSDEVVEVAAIKDPDKFNALDAVLESTGFFEQLDEAYELSPKSKETFAIIVKPNFMFIYAKKDISTYTDPALVEHLVDRIYERGYRNLAVAEARSTYGILFTNREVKTIARHIGLSEKNYRIIDLSEDPIPYRYSGKLGDHHVNREWANADFRIAFAKNKTHSYAYYTLTIKDIYGALPCENKFLEYHCKRDIYTTTIEYIKHFPIHFGLIDASVSADGPFGIFADKYPNPTDTIIGGGDIVAVDWIGASKMGLNPMESDYMKQAVKEFGKPEIKLIGDREIYPNWVNVPDVVSQAAFGLDMNYYLGNLLYSIGAYMDPFFEYRDKRLGRRLARLLLEPKKPLFFQKVEDGTLDADFNRRLYKQFEKAASSRGDRSKFGLAFLAGAGLLGLACLVSKRSRKG